MQSGFGTRKCNCGCKKKNSFGRRRSKRGRKRSLRRLRTRRTRRRRSRKGEKLGKPSPIQVKRLRNRMEKNGFLTKSPRVTLKSFKKVMISAGKKELETMGSLNWSKFPRGTPETDNIMKKIPKKYWNSKSSSKKRSSRRRRTTKRRRKSKRVGRPRDHNRTKPSRGCSKQTTKKYTSRKSPAFPANLCRGQTKKGKYSVMYESKRTNRQGKAYYRWVKVSA